MWIENDFESLKFGFLNAKTLCTLNIEPNDEKFWDLTSGKIQRKKPEAFSNSPQDNIVVALFYPAHQGSCASAGFKHNWGLYLSINVKRLITTRL